MAAGFVRAARAAGGGVRDLVRGCGGDQGGAGTPAAAGGVPVGAHGGVVVPVDARHRGGGGVRDGWGADRAALGSAGGGGRGDGRGRGVGRLVTRVPRGGVVHRRAGG